MAITVAARPTCPAPTWVYFVIAGLILIVLTVVAIRLGRRLRARLAPALGQAAARLLAVMQQLPALAEGIGGALLLTAAYILRPDACIRLWRSVPLASTAAVYLTAALKSAVPTPGAGRGGGGARPR